MGKGTILNKRQKQILDLVAKSDLLKSDFYFTGGTALSEVYLKHRESVDIDLFTPKEFNTEEIFEILTNWSKKLNFSIIPVISGPVYICKLKFSDDSILKVDFAKYPYRELESKINYNGIKIDSLLDIGANKLLTITQRQAVKDFVDLYFLLQKYSFWDLREGVRIKFNVDIEPWIAASDFTLVEEFKTLPKMFKKLDLETLKEFFRNEARALSKESVK